jgi:hypothetical protein
MGNEPSQTSTVGKLELGDDLPNRSAILVDRKIGFEGKIPLGTAAAALQFRYEGNTAYGTAPMPLDGQKCVLTGCADGKLQGALKQQGLPAAQTETGVEDF